MMQMPAVREARTSCKNPTDTRNPSGETDHERDSITIYFKHSKKKAKNELSSDMNSIPHVKSYDCKETIDKCQTGIEGKRESDKGMKIKLHKMDELLQEMEEERKYLKKEIQKLKDEHAGLHQSIQNLYTLHRELQKKSVAKMTSENRETAQKKHTAFDMDEIARKKATRAAKKRYYQAEWRKHRQAHAANQEQEILRKKALSPEGPKCPICGERDVASLEECSNFDVHGADFNYTKKYVEKK